MSELPQFVCTQASRPLRNLYSICIYIIYIYIYIYIYNINIDRYIHTQIHVYIYIYATTDGLCVLYLAKEMCDKADQFPKQSAPWFHIWVLLGLPELLARIVRNSGKAFLGCSAHGVPSSLPCPPLKLHWDSAAGCGSLPQCRLRVDLLACYIMPVQLDRIC